MNTALCFTIFYNVKVTIYFINTIFRFNSFICCTIFTKVIPISRCIRVVFYKTDACVHIAISTKIVCFAINFSPHTGIEFWTITVFCTVFIYYPCTAYEDTVFIEYILYTIDVFFTNSNCVVRFCITITFISCLPAFLENIVNRVVKFAIHFEDACAGFVNFATAFVCTYKLSANDFVVVVEFFKLCAPVNYRFTCFTVCSVFVAFFFCSWSFTESCEFCIVSVQCECFHTTSCHFCSNVNATTE